MQTQLPWRLCADVANAVARADDVASACDAIVAALFGTLFTESVIFAVNERACTRLAGRIDNEREQVWQTHLAGLPPGAPLGLISDRNGHATYVAIGTVANQRVFLVIAADVMESAEELRACAAVVSVGLDALVRQEQSLRQSQLLRRAYRCLRLLSRARGVEGVSQAIVGYVGELFDAERVSLARYDENDDRLRITASRGIPDDLMTSVAVRSGDWVIGHVHQSGRALIVDDPSELPVPGHHRARYRPGAFAVVPLTHHRSIVGVLSMTDRGSGRAFEPEERTLMRLLAPVLGGIMTTAQQQDEAASLRFAATVDSLTGLHNRGYLDRRLHEEVGRSRREGGQVSVLLADIDDFKGVNDSGGHSAGDRVLKHVADVIRSAVRMFDVCARYGGDEFVIVMPNSDPVSAHACAERIRAKTARSLEDAGLPAITLSVGVATARLDNTPAELLERADRALYAAKTSGKNVVRVDGPSHTADVSVTASSPPAAAEIEVGNGAPPLLPYILVADVNPERAGLYRQHADRSQLGLLVARDAAQAQRVMDQFGPPSLLVVDLTAPAMKGVTLLEWFQGKDTDTRIIAYSASPVLKRYLIASGGAAPIRVLPPAASALAIESALAKALPANQLTQQLRSGPDTSDATDVRSIVAALAPKVRGVIPAGGVGVYLRESVDAPMRAGVSWTSEALLTRVHAYLPRVAELVMNSGEPVLIGQVGSERFPAMDKGDIGHSLIATPLRRDGDIIGAVCAFDDGPLTLAENSLSLFEELGVSGLAVNGRAPSSVESIAVAGPPPRSRGSDRSPAASDSTDTVTDEIEWQPTLLERRRGEFEVARELARARRERRQMSVVLFDVSRCRDSGGDQEALDEPLSSVAETLLRVIRPSDLPIRWSGNELLLVLPGLASADARSVAERVRAAMQAGERHRVAISGGVAELQLDEQFGTVVRRARERVMVALHQGHNRVS